MEGRNGRLGWHRKPAEDSIGLAIPFTNVDHLLDKLLFIQLALEYGFSTGSVRGQKLVLRGLRNTYSFLY